MSAESNNLQNHVYQFLQNRFNSYKIKLMEYESKVQNHQEIRYNELQKKIKHQIVTILNNSCTETHKNCTLPPLEYIDDISDMREHNDIIFEYPSTSNTNILQLIQIQNELKTKHKEATKPREGPRTAARAVPPGVRGVG